jgi:hypothetical protein
MRCAPEPGQLEMAARRANYRRGRQLARLWTGSGPAIAVPIKEAEASKPNAAAADRLRVMQTELFSEYWEWHRRVYDLPW